MEKLLDDLIDKCCDMALTECSEYIQKEYSGKYSDDELRPIAEKLIYKRAVKDTINTLRYFGII